MSKTFNGRVIVSGTVKAKALVTHSGFNTLASYQNALMFGDKKAACSDRGNAEIVKKPMAGAALCLPQTIGSTTGGLILFCAAALGQQPACLLFSKPIDSLAAAGSILTDVWTDNPIPTIDGLGDEFLEYVKEGMTVEVLDNGVVRVE